MRLFAMLVILILSPLLAAAPAPKETKETATIDGGWVMTERHINENRDDSTSTIRWTIDGESLVIEVRGEVGFRQLTGPTYRLVKPTDGRANEIDYVLMPADGDLPASTFRGLWKLDGDKLKVCMGGSPEQDRPTACKPSSGTSLYVFKRVKDE